MDVDQSQYQRSAGGLVECPRCRGVLSASAVAATAVAGRVTCRWCSGRFAGVLFPALFRAAAAGQAGEALADPAQSACFFHAGRRAVVACDACGRFLCALCDLPLGSGHLCPSCLDNPAARQRTAAMAPRQSSALLYDNVALALAGLPMLVVWPTLVTAPATLVVVWRYWNRVQSARPRRAHLRFVLAALLALAQIGGWVTLAVALAL